MGGAPSASIGLAPAALWVRDKKRHKAEAEAYSTRPFGYPLEDFAHLNYIGQKEIILTRR